MPRLSAHEQNRKVRTSGAVCSESCTHGSNREGRGIISPLDSNHREGLGWRTNGGAEVSEVLRISTGGLPPADARDMRSHQQGVFWWAGGIGAEVLGVVGEAEAGLFGGVGRKIAECDRERIRDYRLNAMQFSYGLK